MDLFTLHWINHEGTPLSLFNQSAIACRQIEAVHSRGGSHSFERTKQDRELSQIEIDLIRIVQDGAFRVRES